MIFVSDTSPLANLILIGKLELFEQLFGEILVPTAVDKEVIKLKHWAMIFLRMKKRLG